MTDQQTVCKWWSVYWHVSRHDCVWAWSQHSKSEIHPVMQLSYTSFWHLSRSANSLQVMISLLTCIPTWLRVGSVTAQHVWNTPSNAVVIHFLLTSDKISKLFASDDQSTDMCPDMTLPWLSYSMEGTKHIQWCSYHMLPSVFSWYLSRSVKCLQLRINLLTLH